MNQRAIITALAKKVRRWKGVRSVRTTMPANPELPFWTVHSVPVGDIHFTWDGPPKGYDVRMMADGSWWKRDDSGDWVPISGPFAPDEA